MSWIGLDIGGANIKVSDGVDCRSFPFELWKQPNQLTRKISSLLSDYPRSHPLAVTMTGEIADCFSSKQAGVEHIVDSVEEASAGRRTRYLQTDGKLRPARAARQQWLETASANWVGLALYSASFLETGCGFLFDVGSTTADVIPIRHGDVVARGKTDLARLQNRELVYCGVRRTAVPALLDEVPLAGGLTPISRETFATVHDAFLAKGRCPAEPLSCSTADGRPATAEYARHRLARLVCADPAELDPDDIDRIAQATLDRVSQLLVAALTHVLQANPEIPRYFILSGEGCLLSGRWMESVVETAAQQDAGSHWQLSSLRQLIGNGQAAGSAAHAVSWLAGRIFEKRLAN